MARASLGWLLAAWALAAASPASADPALTAKLDAIVRANAGSGKFSGAILVTRDGAIVFDQAYGFADTEHKNPNRTTTSFHIGSLSAQYTAVAVMMLVDKQRLWLANTAGQFLPDIAGGDHLTIADLLARDPKTDPAAWRTLARIVEIVSAKSFAEALDTDFFGPLFMTGSGLDDGTLAPSKRMAQGDATKPVAWADLQGSASAYTTTRDELRWIDAFFDDRLVSAASRQVLLGKPGFGAVLNLGVPNMGPIELGVGESGGFCAEAVHSAARGITVILLGNVPCSSPVLDLVSNLTKLVFENSAP